MTEAINRSWIIWSEGYRATGEEGTATILGTGYGKTFNEAVLDWKAKNPEEAEKYLTYNKTRDTFSYWACRLFDNEADARKSFG